MQEFLVLPDRDPQYDAIDKLTYWDMVMIVYYELKTHPFTRTGSSKKSPYLGYFMARFNSFGGMDPEIKKAFDGWNGGGLA